MVARPRRPLVSLEAQLQQLTLFSDLDAENENLEQLGPIIKSLDEARQQDAFLRHLKQFVREKDQEIEKVCDANHSEFIAAVDKLLKVRSGTVTLKHRIGELNEDVQAGGASLGNKKKQLLETKRVGQNVDDAIDSIQSCLRVLDLANRIDTLIQDKKYFSALRSLQELETVHLKAVLHHEFAKHMLESIPQMRTQVKQAVNREMKEWLFEVREKSRTVGKLALDAMENRQKRWRVKSQRDPMLRLAKVNSAIEMVVNERTEHNFVDNDTVRIDFKPLYQCIHIYDSLDLREELQISYHEDRRAQANLLLSQGLSFDASNPTFPALLEEVVGFFLVEHHVLQTTPSGFRAESEVEDLWDTMCERVVDIVSLGLRDCKDTKVYVSTKAAVQTFIQTLEGYSFSVSKLNALLLTLFERYAQLLRDRFSNDFQQAMRESQHQPMVVHNAEELSKVLSVCWLKPGDSEALKASRFPLSLPFSQTYPLCCMDIRNLVDQYYTFSDGFSQNHREIDEILKKSLDELLIQQVSTGIRRSLDNTSSINLSQVAQIVVNAEHFNLACLELENLLAALRAPHGRGGKLRLDASSHFVTTLSIAETKIGQALASKLDQFIGLAEYDWTTARSKPAGSPAPWLQDALDWLTTMMDSVLVLLPPETKTRAYQASYRHITTSLLDSQLLGPDTARGLSIAALTNLDIDVAYLVANTAADFTPTFAELQQTIRVILTDSVAEYITSPSARSAKWNKAHAKKLASIVDRLAKFHAARGPAEAELVSRRNRERDSLLRLASQMPAHR
ncbi:exocyst complex subunit Sec15-like protein [Testicularia cyperi]|uniref:Exocyst complex component SEC15 n=1 Tax=Testicularia cyperi TaxID=1882483 RepID=A0A317XLW3_9BASI|nr:exocyst complex subunit Sec15-like protein [Testicularia cyperi]